MAAVGAFRAFPGSANKKTVLDNAAKLHDTFPYAGAAGRFGFNVNGQLYPPDIPVYRDSDGTCSLVSAGA